MCAIKPNELTSIGQQLADTLASYTWAEGHGFPESQKDAQRLGLEGTWVECPICQKFILNSAEVKSDVGRPEPDIV